MNDFAMVVTQWMDRWFLKPQIRSSNPVKGGNLLLQTTIMKITHHLKALVRLHNGI